MKVRLVIFLILALACTPVLRAQKPATPEPARATPAAADPSSAGPITSPGQLVGAFFALLQKGSVDAAYASLTRGSKIAEKPEELRLLKAKTNEAIEVFGTVLGFDLVESKAVGQRLLRATYVSHGKTFPLRWRFYFYNPDGNWRLIDLRVDDKLTGIFDEPEERKEIDTKP
jgi:hypothetical protein